MTLNATIGIGIAGLATGVFRVADPVHILGIALIGQAIAWMPNFVNHCLKILRPQSSSAPILPVSSREANLPLSSPPPTDPVSPAAVHPPVPAPLARVEYVPVRPPALNFADPVPNSCSGPTVPVSAPPGSASLTPAAAAPAPPSILKWGAKYSEGFHFVVKRNGETVSDIIGSLHDDEQSICQLNPTVEKAAKEARTVAFECVWDADSIARYNNHLQNSKSETRQKYLDFYQKNYDDLKDFQYSPTSSIKKRSMVRNCGTEMLIQKICKSTGSTMSALETPEEMAEASNYGTFGHEINNQMIASGSLSVEELLFAENDSISAFQGGNDRLFSAFKKWSIPKKVEESVA